MEEQTSFPFLQLPDVVIRNTFLPLLPLNTMLRLRLISKAVKNIADDYLRLKVPSNNIIILNYSGQLRNFVNEDLASSIRHPSSSLSIREYTDQGDNPVEYFQNILSCERFKHVSTQYSAQITNLDIQCLKLSMEPNSPEFQFFQGFVNLKNLFAHSVFDRYENEEIGTISVPSSLKNLKSFGFCWYHTTTREQDSVWEFINQLENLEHVYFPEKAILFDQPIPLDADVDDDDTDFVVTRAVAMLPKFTEMLKSGRNTRLQIVTLSFMERSEYRESNAVVQMNLKTNLENFVKMCAQYKIKWNKIDVAWLQILDKQQLGKIAPLVISIDAYKGEDLKGAVFPNLCYLCTTDIFKPVHNETLSVTSLLERMSAAIFPNLKDLHISEMSSDKDNEILAQLWEHLPLLENLTLGFYCKRHLSNEAFLGRDFYPYGEREQLPCFFKLKALKKLEIYLHEANLVTDAVFYDVFRHMKLKEFHIHSCDNISYGHVSYLPLKSISKYGIMALLTGPFFEANERFPFKDFQLKGVSDEEHSRLGRLFPANQIF